MKSALTLALFYSWPLRGSIPEKSPKSRSTNSSFITFLSPTNRGIRRFFFPRQSRALAKSVAVQEQPNADFLISFTPGNFYFTIRALKPEADDHLTVIYNRKAYVLHLRASDKPFYTVTFFQDVSPGGRRAHLP